MCDSCKILPPDHLSQSQSGDTTSLTTVQINAGEGLVVTVVNGSPAYVFNVGHEPPGDWNIFQLSVGMIGVSSNPGSYRKTHQYTRPDSIVCNEVSLKGLVQYDFVDTTTEILFTTIPDGYRPPEERLFPVVVQFGTARHIGAIRITTTGDLYLVPGTSWVDIAGDWDVSLDGITYEALA